MLTWLVRVGHSGLPPRFMFVSRAWHRGEAGHCPQASIPHRRTCYGISTSRRCLVHLLVSSSGVTFLRAPRGLGERLPVYLGVCEAGRCRPGEPWALAVMRACASGHLATV